MKNTVNALIACNKIIFSMKVRLCSIIIFLFLLCNAMVAQAQFEVPEFDKVTASERAEFQRRFRATKWTGQGMYRGTPIDNQKTNEVRARLQAVFGSPTQTIEDLIGQPDFRPGKAIQFEYWFVINDSIPLMILDVDGPFGRGLVYGAASRYIDLMPQIKRAFSSMLMNVDSLGNYQDYYYSPERAQWFDVRYQNGEFTTKKIGSPPGMTYNY